MKMVRALTLLTLSLSSLAVSAKLIEYTPGYKEDFSLIIKKGTVVVDFYAPWCGPCKRLTPQIERLAEKYPQVTFVKVNIDANEKLKNQYKIGGVPTVHVYKNGNLVTRNAGQDRASIEHYIK